MLDIYYVRYYGDNNDLFMYLMISLCLIINGNNLEKVELFGNKHKEKLIF